MNNKLFEKLATIEHERWADWQEYMFDCAVKSGDDNLGIRTFAFPTKQVENWQRQIEMPYDELSEQEKESDREQVRRYWPLLQQHDEELIEILQQSKDPDSDFDALSYNAVLDKIIALIKSRQSGEEVR